MTPPPRVNTQETTSDVSPVPPLRVDPHGDIALQPGHAPIQPPQRIPHIIPYDTKPMPPAAHQNTEETHKIPTQHRYNTRARIIQGQDLMENHVATINTPPSKPSKPAPLVRPAGEDWAVIDQVTGNLTLRPGRANAVICPETGNTQEYQHLIKGTEKSNVERSCQMKLDDFSKGLGTYRELTLAFSSIGTKSPKTPRSHIAALSTTFGPIRKRCTECDSLWEYMDSPLMDQSSPQHPISPPQNCIGTASY